MLDIAPLLRRRRLVTTLALVVGLVAGAGIGRLELDNTPQGFFADDSRQLDGYRQLVGAFGSDRLLRVVLSGEALWSDDGLTWLAELEDRLVEVPGVLAVAGLSGYRQALGDDWLPPDPAAFRHLVRRDPVARQAGWVTADGGFATITVVIARRPARGAATALAAVTRLAEAGATGTTATVVGLPLVERSLDEEATTMMRRFLPALAVVLLIALVVLFRRPRQVAAVVGLVVLVEATTLGAMGWSGGRLDVITALLIPLVAVVATATAVHLLVRFRQLRESGLDGEGAARELVRQKAAAVTWAGLTTAASFASLAVAPVPAVRSLGLWAAFGFATTTLAALAPLPCLLAGERGTSTTTPLPWAAWAHRFGRRCAALAVARRRIVCLAFAAVAALALAGALQLRPSSDLLGLLTAEHPIRRETSGLEGAGLATATADLLLVLPADRAGGFADPGRLAGLARLSQALRDEPLAWGALSAGDLVARWRSADEDLDAASWAWARERVASRPEAERLLSFLVSGDGRRARVVLAVPMSRADGMDAFFATARSEARAAFPDAESFVTGTYPLVLASQRRLLVTMLLSLALAVVVVAASLRVVLGEMALAGRALAANLWPVLIALGVMGWAAVPLDSATVAVAAVALGLAVDDSLHTLADFRRLAPDAGRSEAVVTALARNAPAHLATALLLAGGLALFGLSGLVPAARFGLLTAVAVAAALLADLLLIPALLAVTAPRSAAVRPVAGGPATPTRRPPGAPTPGR